MEPVNFSEVIAQIHVEIQQLGWTTDQVRELLKKNYRGHTLLTEVELLDFLQYLAPQPTSGLDEALIAKINVEIERLCWTRQQGREHLKKTYRKRSRTLLTEVELLDFLQYLASLPTPTLDEALIAKINVEIERLLWTQKEEKQYFITTYNKSVRTLLTQEELLDFLRYLESHPIPEDNSELYEEYEEFQNLSIYSEESDNIITKMYPVHLLYPADFFEVLTQTNAEMQRLGLTVEWGREHLIRTYGKRSRFLLTEAELLDFRQYLASLVSQATPADLSDVIAKTDVELQRLGWTPEQGREHLIETYGKRGRTLLTKEELDGFLKYLQSQPDPITGF